MILETFRQALQNVWSNKLRTFGHWCAIRR